MIHFLQKYLSSLIIVVFFFVFAGLYGGEYVEYHKEHAELGQVFEESTENLKEFSFDALSQIDGISLMYTPENLVLDTLIQKVNAAKTRVYVEVYIFTQKSFRDALLRAQKRGVDVRVLLENNPYMAPNLNNAIFYDLQKGGVQVQWSNADNYALNHSKIYLVDDELILSTGNMSHSTFTYNREFFLVVSDPKLVSVMEDNFQYDFLGDPYWSYDHRLVQSPYDSRVKLEYLLKNAKQSIQMYVPYFSDTSIVSLLQEQARLGKKIEIITPSTDDEEELKDIDALREAGVIVYMRKKPYIHAKALLVDGEYVYLGSINYSQYSMDENREFGLLISNPSLIEDFLQVFISDREIK